jgi:hypothetical protein
MARENKQVQKDFLQIKNGKIIQILTEKTETSKEFETKTGRKYHAEVFTNVISNVKYLQVFTDEYDGIEYKKLSVTMCDNEQKWECLTMSFTSNCAASLITRLYSPDFNPLDEINIGVFKDKEGFDVLFTKQKGITLKSPFNENNPLPAWNKTTVNKKVLWDKSEYLDMLELLVEKINSRLKFEPETMATVNPITRTDESLLLVDDKKEDFFF